MSSLPHSYQIRLAVNAFPALRLAAALLLALIVSVFAFGDSAAAQSPGGAEPVAPQITLTHIAANLEQPIFVTHAGDGSGRLFVVERGGTVKIVAGGATLETPFLDITDKVKSSCDECGLLGLAFAPDYATSGVLYVFYTSKENVAPPIDGEPEAGNDTVIERYLVSGNPNRVDPDSSQQVLAVNQPYTNHNGGQIGFGPDGYLYVGLGDGGSGGDPGNNAQNLGRLLGKMLRIDVSDALIYTIPPDNPFVVRAANADSPNGIAARGEIWAYGLRNPWRWSFDRETGDLWIGDVGQGAWEEVNLQPASSTGGENYGWRYMEGAHCYNPSSNCPTDGLTYPVVEYANPGFAAVTGGYVHRGPQSSLNGIYMYGDFASGAVWGLVPNGASWTNYLLEDTAHRIVSFGEDEAGNLYLVAYSGNIYRIDAVLPELPYSFFAPVVRTAQAE